MDSKENNKNSPVPFPVSDLTWDHFIYPRAAKSDKTISAYVESLAAGADFPPITIQRIFNYTGDAEKPEATIIIDGIHRWHAFRNAASKRSPPLH